MRSTWKGRAGVLVGVAVGPAAGGIAYAAIPSSGSVVRGTASSSHVFLVGSSGTVPIGPHAGTRVGLGAANSPEAPVSLPVSGTLTHFHAALDHNVSSPGVNVAIYVNGTSTTST